MGMKYKDPSTGQLKELSLKAADTLPIGTIVDYDGNEVPEGWEEYGTEDYSTEETFTGKHWIDGKPIYRKVSNVSISDKSNWTSLISIPNLDRLTNVYGFGNNVTLPRYESPNYYVQFLFEVDYLKYMAHGISGSVTIVTEYTKTTD